MDLPVDGEGEVSAEGFAPRNVIAMQVPLASPVLNQPNALVQLQAHNHHCGEAASERCLSAATFVSQRGTVRCVTRL